MDSILDAGLRNAALAVPLAVVVMILGLAVRRPALLHLLWIVVLLRLVLPPIWNVAVPRPTDAVQTERTAEVIAEETTAPTDEVVAPATAADWWHSIFGDWRIAPAAIEAPPAVVEEVVTATETAPEVKEPAPLVRPSWRSVVAFGWIAGSTLLMLLTVIRLIGFMLALRRAIPAGRATQAEVDDMARVLQIRRVPRVLLVDACISPMLWGLFTRPRLILPLPLWSTLGPRQRSTLLAHELAHYGRGDQWVRWLEVAATILFWWHPVVWVARRQLREAEEQCCDAWVVWALPDSRRDYATALVDTVGFLSKGRSALPAFASGVGQVRHLRRRLTMIMRDTTPRRLPRLALAALLGGGLALGSVAPTWGEDDRKDPPPAERREERRREERREESKPTDEPRRGDDREARERSDRDRAEAMKELERARADFEKARQRLEQLERRLAGRDNERPRTPTPAREGGRGEDRRPDDGPRGGGGRGGAGGGAGMPGMPGMPGGGGFGGMGGGGVGGMPGGAPLERRLENVERRLEEITRLLDEIRRGNQRSGPGGDRAPGTGGGMGGGAGGRERGPGRGPGPGGPGGGASGPGGPGGPGGGAGGGPGAGPGGPPGNRPPSDGQEEPRRENR